MLFLMPANGPAIKRAEREVPTCFVRIARSQTAGWALPDPAPTEASGTASGQGLGIFVRHGGAKTLSDWRQPGRRDNLSREAGNNLPLLSVLCVVLLFIKNII